MHTEQFKRASLIIAPIDGGWGYQWPHADQHGPYSTPEYALMAAFHEANDQINAHRMEKLLHIEAQQAETEELPAITALQTICAAFVTMRETPLGDINEPEVGDAFSRALLAADNGYGTLEVLMKQWNNELTRQHERQQRAHRRLMEME